MPYDAECRACGQRGPVTEFRLSHRAEWHCLDRDGCWARQDAQRFEQAELVRQALARQSLKHLPRNVYER